MSFSSSPLPNALCNAFARCEADTMVSEPQTKKRKTIRIDTEKPDCLVNWNRRMKTHIEFPVSLMVGTPVYVKDLTGDWLKATIVQVNRLAKVPFLAADIDDCGGASRHPPFNNPDGFQIVKIPLALLDEYQFHIRPRRMLCPTNATQALLDSDFPQKISQVVHSWHECKVDLIDTEEDADDEEFSPDGITDETILEACEAKAKAKASTGVPLVPIMDVMAKARPAPLRIVSKQPPPAPKAASEPGRGSQELRQPPLRGSVARMVGEESVRAQARERLSRALDVQFARMECRRQANFVAKAEAVMPPGVTVTHPTADTLEDQIEEEVA